MSSDSADFFSKIREKNDLLEDQRLNSFASFSKDAVRKSDYGNKSIRPAYLRDSDRIIHSLSFSRFADKTQVFFWIDSDVFQHRLMHVQLVSKISRYIARILGLNEDLAESISLGHDIGHCPFGHDGERILSKLCRNNNIGDFRHNYESVWFLNNVEMQNLTLQTLDGILCHNGELHERKLKPERKNLSWIQLEQDANEVRFNPSGKKCPNPKPKTMEGALVRYVDTISYISRDIREAENLNITKFGDLSSSIKQTLGNSNRTILNSLITDLIENSLNQDYISYGEEVNNALMELYEFNLEKIYLHPKKKVTTNYLDAAFPRLWEQFVSDLESDRRESEVFFDHFQYNVNDIQSRYPEIKNVEDYPYYQEQYANGNKNPHVIVRDFIAGMTDGYFIKMTKKYAPDLEYKRISI